MSESRTDKAPLDEVMMAMDVVDTLRHQKLLVDRELNSGEREKKLIERLRKLYASQGIEVSDRILAEGVKALEAGRFTYKPPAKNFQTFLARTYIERGKWSKLLGVAALVLTVLWGGWYLTFQAPENRHLERLEGLPAELIAERDAIQSIATVNDVKQRADSQYQVAIAALSTGDTDTALNIYSSLQSLHQVLSSSYTLRVVSQPGERSGVWREPNDNPGAKNYYLLVEAIDSSGKLVTLPVTNEEDGKIYSVDKWGLRVAHSLYQQVAADKQDDGIIQQRKVGVKKIGYLEPKYNISTTGAKITSW